MNQTLCDRCKQIISSEDACWEAELVISDSLSNECLEDETLEEVCTTCSKELVQLFRQWRTTKPPTIL